MDLGDKDTTFSKTALDDLSFWALEDRKIFKRVIKLIMDIHRNGPLAGEGRPERLKHSDRYSRRINEEHRLVYKMDLGRLLVLSCRGHYKDG